jgi:hypothetical protein
MSSGKKLLPTKKNSVKTHISLLIFFLGCFFAAMHVLAIFFRCNARAIFLVLKNVNTIWQCPCKWNPRQRIPKPFFDARSMNLVATCRLNALHTKFMAGTTYSTSQCLPFLLEFSPPHFSCGNIIWWFHSYSSCLLWFVIAMICFLCLLCRYAASLEANIFMWFPI